MPRLPRNLDISQENAYHIRGQVAGHLGDYPLANPENARKLLDLFRHFTSLFFCQVVAFSIMGNHHHLVCTFDAFRRLSRQQLLELAQRFYPSPRYRPYLQWVDSDWERFNRRLFSASELMRNIHAAYARWFNDRYERKGHFWADRFHCTRCNNLIETALYVDLNAVRARLKDRPEDFPYSSCHLRQLGLDDWLLPLEEWIGFPQQPRRARREYWQRLYWRGTRPSQPGGGVIPDHFVHQMEAEGCPRGCYLRSIPGFTRGVFLGTYDEVLQELTRYRNLGYYSRRKHPVPLGVANLFMLREQRRNSVAI